MIYKLLSSHPQPSFFIIKHIELILSQQVIFSCSQINFECNFVNSQIFSTVPIKIWTADLWELFQQLHQDPRITLALHAASQWELMLSCWSTMAHKTLQSQGIPRHCTPFFGGKFLCIDV